MNRNATIISEFPATDLVGRVVFNPNGVEFLVVGLNLHTTSGKIVIEIDEIDLDTHELLGAPCGIFSLSGWEVGTRLPHLLAQTGR